MFKVKKIIYFLFLFLLVIPIVYSLDYETEHYNFTIDTIFFNETFDYADGITAHGWKYYDSGDDGQCDEIPDSNQIGCKLDSSPSPTYYMSIFNDNNWSSYPTGHVFVYIKYNVSSDKNWNSLWVLHRINDNNHFLRDWVYQSASSHLSLTRFGVESYWTLANNFTYTGERSSELLYDLEDGIGAQFYLDGSLTAGLNDNYQYMYYNVSNFSVSFTASATGYYYIDEIMVFNGSLSGGTSYTTCEYPILFCDDFNYGTSIFYAKNWIPQNYDGSLNTTLAPVSNRLYLNDTRVSDVSHEIDNFEVNYPISSGVNITQSIYAPAFSNEFDINFMNSSVHLVSFNLYDFEGRDCYTLRFNRSSAEESLCVLLKNSTDIEIMTCDLKVNTTYTIKSTAYFMYHDVYKFNVSSVFSDSQVVNLFIDNVNYGGINFDSDCESVFEAEFVKNDGDSNFSIDNYYMYAGYDKNIDTIPYLFNPIFIPDETTSTTGAETTELAEAVEDMWCTMGLCSTASRLILALIILVVISLGVGGGMVYYHVHGSAIAILVGIVDFFTMILFVYLGLIPIWIVIVFSLLVVGLFILGAKVVFS